MKHFLSYAVLLTAGFSCACSNRADLAPDVAASIRKSLDQSGVKGVSVSQDRTKGVVTLGGNVATADEKSRAESLARSLAANQVVADEIAVIPAGDTSATRTMYSDLDKGIENNLDAALIAGGFRSGIHHTVKNGVVTLTGSVNDEAQRNQVTQIAQGVPNTQQVVNELETTHTKATASR